MNIGQADLVLGILTLLEKRKVAVNVRQTNAVINAANDIMDELRRPHTEAAPGCGLRAWYASDSTGLSSRYMASVLAPLAGLMGAGTPGTINYPHDPADFGRCLTLLDAAPELRPHLAALANGHGPAWAGLIAAWAELETLYREELPSGKAPSCFSGCGQSKSRHKKGQSDAVQPNQ